MHSPISSFKQSTNCNRVSRTHLSSQIEINISRDMFSVATHRNSREQYLWKCNSFNKYSKSDVA